MNRFKMNLFVLAALCSIAATSAAPCDSAGNAAEAFEALEKLQAADPKIELDEAFEDLKVLLDDECDSREESTAEADLEDFAWDLLDDSGQAASGCGTEARNDLKECKADCKAAGKKFCGCVAAFIIDVIGCVDVL